MNKQKSNNGILWLMGAGVVCWLAVTAAIGIAGDHSSPYTPPQPYNWSKSPDLGTAPEIREYNTRRAYLREQAANGDRDALAAYERLVYEEGQFNPR
jgi:hypothetical protein